MAFARHGSGVGTVLSAYGSQIHPVFMLPPVAASLFGVVLAGGGDVAVLVLHASAVFAAVYTAHLKDGYVDFHLRREDDDHPLTSAGCRLGLVGSTVAFLCCLVGLWLTAGALAVALTAPTWLLGYFHAPQLDTNPLTTTLGYPVGIGLAIVGSFAAQTGSLAATPVAVAAVFVVLLASVKVVDDATDVAYDRRIDKRTVAVVLGTAEARRLAGWLRGVSLFAVVAFAVDGLLPPAAVLAVVAFALVWLPARRADPRVATMLLVRGSYVFLAVLVVAVWFRPLAGVGVPSIAVLGPYTYLATEVVFGALALALLVRADAVGSAARTVAVLYPLAYVWDWYTLEVGVFAIPLRTGVTLLGIPVEEHLFMLVVPALVLGVHETLRSSDDVGRT